MSNHMKVAHTILSQIGANSIMCLGVPLNTIHAIPATDKHDGGLEFKFTNCPKVRTGKVRVTLAFNDTYNVEILNIRGRAIYSESNIYSDQLGGPKGVIERVTG